MMMTKADSVYALLRKAIVTGEISGDGFLDELNLVERYNVGRTPLREALKRLSRDGLLVAGARRTPYVRTLSATELHRLYETRVILEEPAVRLAAGRFTDESLAGVIAAHDDLGAFARDGDVYASIEADHAFHLAVAKASDNRFLVEAIDRLNCESLHLWYKAHIALGYEKVAEQHNQIIDGIRTKDENRAAEAMRGHIANSLARQVELFSHSA